MRLLLRLLGEKWVSGILGILAIILTQNLKK